MQKIPLAMGLVVAVALVAAETATACTCVRVSPADKLREADGAAVARLVAVRPLDDGEGPIPGEGPISSADPTDFIYRTGGCSRASRACGAADGSWFAVCATRRAAASRARSGA